MPFQRIGRHRKQVPDKVSALESRVCIAAVVIPFFVVVRKNAFITAAASEVLIIIGIVNKAHTRMPAFVKRLQCGFQPCILLEIQRLSHGVLVSSVCGIGICSDVLIPDIGNQIRLRLRRRGIRIFRLQSQIPPLGSGHRLRQERTVRIAVLINAVVNQAADRLHARIDNGVIHIGRSPPSGGFQNLGLPGRLVNKPLIVDGAGVRHA